MRSPSPTPTDSSSAISDVPVTSTAAMFHRPRLSVMFVLTSFAVMLATASAAVGTGVAFAPSLCRSALQSNRNDSTLGKLPSSTQTMHPFYRSRKTSLRAAIPPEDPERVQARRAALLVALLGALGIMLDNAPNFFHVFQPVPDTLDVIGFDLRGPRQVASAHPANVHVLRAREMMQAPFRRTSPLPPETEKRMDDAAELIRNMQRNVYKRMRVRHAAAQAARKMQKMVEIENPRGSSHCWPPK